MATATRAQKTAMLAVTALLTLLLTALAASPARAATTANLGYDLIGADGSVHAFGQTAATAPAGAHNVVGAAPTHDGQGYWEANSAGGIYTAGDAINQGSMAGQPLTQPVVGMAADPATGGYWEVAADGGVFSFNAGFFGSAGNLKLTKPIVGIAATPDGGGYWLVAADGGIFNYGDAHFFGSAGNLKLVKPVVGMTPNPTGTGYWLVASDGGIFTYGTTPFEGSAGNLKLVKPIVAMTATPDGQGYWLAASDGGIFNYGDAPFQGSAGNQTLAAAVTTIIPQAGPPLRIVLNSLPNGTEGTAYSQQVYATGGTGADTWTATGLPAGLKMSPTGLVSGTPTGPSTGTVTVTVTDGAGDRATVAFPLTVVAAFVQTREAYAPVDSLTSVTCPTATRCIATGGRNAGRAEMITSDDAGRTWTDRTLPPLLDEIASVSCPTSTICIGVGLNDYNALVDIVSTDAGTTWQLGTQGGANDLVSLSCPNPARCVAVGTGVASGGTSSGPAETFVLDNGSWTPGTLPTGAATTLSGVACPVAADCVAVGELSATTANGTSSGVFLHSTDGGQTWASVVAPADITALSAVTCTSATTCTAVGTATSASDSYGAAIAQTTDGGSTWSERTISQPAGYYGTPSNLTAVSCPTALRCVAMGPAADSVTTSDGGATWTEVSGGNSYLERLADVACVTGGTCVAVGDELFSIPTPNGSTDSVVATTGDDGLTWTTSKVPPGEITPQALSCATSSHCVAIVPTSTGYSTVTVSDNGGRTWTDQTPQLPADVSGLSCPTATHCAATGSGITDASFTSDDGGATWTTHVLPTDLGLGAVSCPTATTCTALGAVADDDADQNVAATSTDGGATWTTHDLPGTGQVIGLSCPSVTTCYAAGVTATGSTTPGEQIEGVVLSTTDGGTTWVSHPLASGVYALEGISCLSASICTAVGVDFLSAVVTTTTDGGATWTTQPVDVDASIDGLQAVSCAPGTGCYAGGYTGNSGLVVAPDASGVWTAQSVPADVIPVSVVSCTTGECVLGGEGGDLGGSALLRD